MMIIDRNIDDSDYSDLEVELFILLLFIMVWMFIDYLADGL